ncbi:putative adenosine monophosphate-protein transferase fic [Klebsiella pneumoniae]|nr:putative adenosine monophosphate-protein transferase fic [Klebsiella pneumoniae]
MVKLMCTFRLGNGLTQRIFFEQLAIHTFLTGVTLTAGWSAACQQSAMGDLARWWRSFAKW